MPIDIGWSTFGPRSMEIAIRANNFDFKIGRTGFTRHVPIHLASDQPWIDRVNHDDSPSLRFSLATEQAIEYPKPPICSLIRLSSK